MHRHHQRFVDLPEVGFEAFDRRLGVEDDGVLKTHRTDALQLRVEITIGLDVDLDRLRAGLGEGLKIEVGTRHHEVHVPVEPRRRALCKRHDVRTERQVRHEVRIHDVKMQRLRAGRLRPQDLVPEPSEIGRQKRG